jgi:hypothetical protein
MEPAAAFHILDGPQAGLVVPVQRGWAPAACATARAIVLPGLAARARIWLHDGCVTIEPRGTFVRLNGQPVSAETAVRDGDLLHVLDHDGTEVVLQFQQATGRAPRGRIVDVTHEVLAKGAPVRGRLLSSRPVALSRTPVAWRIAQAWLGVRRQVAEARGRVVEAARPIPVTARAGSRGPVPVPPRPARKGNRAGLRVVGGRDHRPAAPVASAEGRLPGRLAALGVAIVLFVLALVLLRPVTRTPGETIPVSGAAAPLVERALSYLRG